MRESVVIPRRFNGPPNSGHGGYVAGTIADLVLRNAAAASDAGVEVTLRKPPPLETALQIERAGEIVALHDEHGDAVASGAPRICELTVPEMPAVDAVEKAWRKSARLQPGASFPTCVACGPDRAEGDGLRIFAGPVEGRDMVAAPWFTDSNLAEADGYVAARYIWTALDCPSYAALEVGRQSVPALLGRICGTVRQPVAAGQRTTIIAWPLGNDGRKLYSASALFAADGTLCAYAKMTWIVVR